MSGRRAISNPRSENSDSRDVLNGFEMAARDISEAIQPHQTTPATEALFEKRVNQVLIIENPDALLSPGERAAASSEHTPNPLTWLHPELPSHVKVNECVT